MPSIDVYDKDYTSAGQAATINFAVLVPGPVVDSAKFDEVADKNGVYQCSNLKDFKENVGVVTTISAPYPSELVVLNVEGADIDAQVIWAPSDETADDPTKYLEFDEFYDANKDCVYTVSNITKLNPATPADAAKILAIENGTYGDTYADSYKNVVKLEDSYYILTGLSAEPIKPEPGYDTYYLNEPKYIAISRLGQDTNEVFAYGNQIAYELINMGYTVLYKKFNSVDELIKITTPKTSIELDNFWGPVTDKSMYNFRFIISGFNSSDQISSLDTLYEKLVDVAAYRKDCIALLDIDEKEYSGTISYTDKLNAAKTWLQTKTQYATAIDINYEPKGRCAAIFTPAVTYSHLASTDYHNITLPASFHYLACFDRAMDNGFAEWYAIAGETRGLNSGFVVKSTTADFGVAAANALEPRTLPDGITNMVAANVITKFNRGSYLLWGNRTAAPLTDKGLTAKHFLNIRQLVSTAAQELYADCKRYSWDPNSDTLWTNFCMTIRPTLERMKANEGIRDYKIIKVAADQKATFNAKVRIIPIEAVEDFNIEISLEDTFGEPTINN